MSGCQWLTSHFFSYELLENVYESIKFSIYSWISQNFTDLKAVSHFLLCNESFYTENWFIIIMSQLKITASRKKWFTGLHSVKSQLFHFQRDEMNIYHN